MNRRLSTVVLVLATSLGLLLSTASAQHVDPNAVGSADSRVPQDQQTIIEMTTGIQKAQPPARSLKERIAAEGGVLLTKDEVAAHLSGNTQQWSNGGAHYGTDGRLDFIWEGNTFTDYRWKVRGQGRVCITNPDGFTTSCSLYFNYNGEIWTVVTEEFGERRDFFGGPDTILVGKKLDDLEPWDPALQ